MADLTVTATQVAAVYPAQARIRSVLLAETVTAGQAAYQLATGAFGVADANAAGKQQFRGIFLEGGGAGQAVSLLEQGEVYGFGLSGPDCDALAYLSDTAGALADGTGTMTVIAGRVVAIPDKALTKVLYVRADWLRNWS